MTKAILCFVFFVLLFGILSGVQWSVSNSFPSPSSSWIEVKVNDQIVITASLDANPRYFQVQVFDLVQVIYHMGIPMLAFMDDYTIYDHNGQVIVSEGQGNAIPQSMAQPMLITDPTVAPFIISPMITTSCSLVSRIIIMAMKIIPPGSAE